MGTQNPNRTKSIPSLRNPKCYARAMGGCCGEINLEHYVSKSILELVYARFGAVTGFVLVQNLTFQDPDTLEQKGIGDLTARILCTVHNGLLSPFDSVGKAMFLAMDALNEKSLDHQLPAVSAQVDGDKLERWLLKTLYGGLYSGNFPPPSGISLKRVCPSDSGLDILFNDAPFPPGLGLYYVYRRPGELITTDPLILKCKPQHAEGRVIGLSVWFFGFEFLLLSEGLKAQPDSFEMVAFRPSGFRDIKTGARIQFDWKSGAESDDIEVAGRGLVRTA
jgi:hypothetical protein